MVKSRIRWRCVRRLCLFRRRIPAVVSGRTGAPATRPRNLRSVVWLTVVQNLRRTRRYAAAIRAWPLAGVCPVLPVLPCRFDDPETARRLLLRTACRRLFCGQCSRDGLRGSSRKPRGSARAARHRSPSESRSRRMPTPSGPRSFTCGAWTGMRIGS